MPCKGRVSASEKETRLDVARPTRHSCGFAVLQDHSHAVDRAKPAERKRPHGDPALSSPENCSGIALSQRLIMFKHGQVPVLRPGTGRAPEFRTKSSVPYDARASGQASGNSRLAIDQKNRPVRNRN